MQPSLAVSTAVFRNGKVLIARRAAEPGRGLWSLPGGRVEAGETLVAAAQRELLEEAGVEAAIIGLSAIREIILRDETGAVTEHFVVLAHAGLWVAGEPGTSAEADEIAWVDPHDLGGRPTTEGLAVVLAEAAAIVAAALNHRAGRSKVGA